MSLDLATLTLLAEPTTRRVFDLVVKDRSIRFADLVKRVQLDPNAARTKLQELKGARLIDEKGSVIEDFNTYYVTADGLEASRESRKAGI